jgi:hypothetical protein
MSEFFFQDRKNEPTEEKMFINIVLIGKGKAVQLQAWTGLESSRKLRLPDFVTTAQDGGRHRPPLPPRNTAGTPLC